MPFNVNMATSRVVHILENRPRTPNKFVSELADWIARYITCCTNWYVCIDRPIYLPPNVHQIVSANTLMSTIRIWLKIIRWNPDRIIFHSLPPRRHQLVLALFPHLRRRSYMTIWGGEIHHLKAPGTIREKLARYLNSRFLRWPGNLIATPLDHELLQRTLGNVGEFVDASPFYPSNVIQVGTRPARKPAHGSIRVLIGNSGHERNNHVDAFDHVLQVDTEAHEYLIPLSYGGTEFYRRTVCARAREAFGGRASVLADFLPRSEYLEILHGIDIVVFNHEGQQAFGNMLQALALGAKVYLKRSSFNYAFCNERNIKVFDIEEYDGNPEFGQRESNITIVRSLYSHDTWKRNVHSVLCSKGTHGDETGHG